MTPRSRRTKMRGGRVPRRRRDALESKEQRLERARELDEEDLPCAS